MTDLYDLAIIRQHVGWLKIYTQMMTADNWQDMRLHCARQLDELAKITTPPAEREPHSTTEA